MRIMQFQYLRIVLPLLVLEDKSKLSSIFGTDTHILVPPSYLYINFSRSETVMKPWEIYVNFCLYILLGFFFNVR